MAKKQCNLHKDHSDLHTVPLPGVTLKTLRWSPRLTSSEPRRKDPLWVAIGEAVPCISLKRDNMLMWMGVSRVPEE